MSGVLGAILAVGFFSLLIALSRRLGSGINFYRLSGLIEGGTALYLGLQSHAWSWVALGIVWLLVKVVLVPITLVTTFPSHAYSIHAPGTPRLLLGAAVVFAVLGWSLGPVGFAVSTVVLPFWLITQRRETWVQGILFLEAEIGVGLTLLILHAGPSAADVYGAIELLATAVLLAWLHVRQTRDFGDQVTSDMLARLKG